MGSLEHARAFPAWLRKIVLKHCDRHRRRKRLPTVPLERHAEAISADSEPSTVAERRELARRVLKEIQTLPESQREVTTLFYLEGHTQEDISGFLEIPVPTIKSRLQLARRKLKSRIMDMVEESLSENRPDDRFSRRVIASLLSRPKPLEIEGHPVCSIWDGVRAALSDYEVVEGGNAPTIGL